MATTGKKARSVNHPSKVILKILFKEILQQITPEDAESLTERYRQGGVIGFHIKENSRGTGYKTAFHPYVESDVAVRTSAEQPKVDDKPQVCRVCGRELTNGKCVFINHKN
jgi:hypothetical protein